MYAKSALRKFVEQPEERKERSVLTGFKLVSPSAVVGIRADSQSEKVVSLNCVIDTGSSFSLSLPKSIFQDLEDFRLMPEHNQVATLGDGTEVLREAFLANLLIASLSIDCICYLSEGLDEPLIGIALFHDHLDLEISKGIFRIKPSQKPRF